MTNVDQFESTFRAAARDLFEYQPIEISSALLITDLEVDAAEALLADVRRFVSVLGLDDDAWTLLRGGSTRDVKVMLDVVNESSAQLVCTYRHLHGEGWRWPFTLGDHLEVLTQQTQVPVLVVPHPLAGRAHEHAMTDTSFVMAITDHLTGDSRLVNWAAGFTEPGGTLCLTHVEDLEAFERYIDVIGKIPTLDTENARETIRERLLKEPHDFIRSCREGLEAAGLEIRIDEIVALGHRLRSYAGYVDERQIDLLVFNSKDEDQMAMHGLAYPLAVELRQIPLLML